MPGGSSSVAGLSGESAPFARIFSDARASSGITGLATSADGILPALGAEPGGPEGTIPDLDPLPGTAAPGAAVTATINARVAGNEAPAVAEALAAVQVSRVASAGPADGGGGKPLPPTAAPSGNPLPAAAAADPDPAPPAPRPGLPPAAMHPESVAPLPVSNPPARAMATADGTAPQNPPVTSNATAAAEPAAMAVPAALAAASRAPGANSGRLPGDSAGTPSAPPAESAGAPGRTLPATGEPPEASGRPAAVTAAELRAESRPAAADAPTANTGVTARGAASAPATETLGASVRFADGDPARPPISASVPGQPRDINPAAASAQNVAIGETRGAAEATVRERAFFDRLLDAGAERAGADRQPVMLAAADRRSAGDLSQRRFATPREVTDAADGRPLGVSEQRDATGVALTARPVNAVLVGRDLSALAERVEALMHRGNGAARISVNLGELGDVEVSVRMESREAHVRFVVQDAAVREALDAQLPRLRQLLEESGLRLGDVSTGLPGGSSDDTGRREAFDRRTAAGEGASTVQLPDTGHDAVETPAPGRLDHQHLLDAIV